VEEEHVRPDPMHGLSQIQVALITGLALDEQDSRVLTRPVGQVQDRVDPASTAPVRR